MKTQPLNLFIIDDNALMLEGLRAYLDKRFGTELNISTYYSGESALKVLGSDTNIVILDYYLDGENGNDILMAIKKINPQTEVIMLSSNEDIAVAIDSFRKGATDYVIKGEKAWRKLTSLIYGILTYPVRVLIKEFGISKYLAMFFFAFACVGTGVYVIMKFIP